jgi:hypothetical protein
MAMQRQLWSINALSNELGRDRRTLAKLLSDLPPAEEKHVGKRIEKRWQLLDVLHHLSEPQAVEDNFEAWMLDHLSKRLFPALVNSSAFVGTMLSNGIDEGLTKHQAVRMLQTAMLAIISGLDEITESKLDYKAEGLLEFLVEHGIDHYINECWPEFEAA